MELKKLRWIQSKVKFALLRSILLRLQGSRQKLVNEKVDIELEQTSIKKLLIKTFVYTVLLIAFLTSAAFHFRNKLTIIVEFYICNKCTAYQKKRKKQRIRSN